MLKIHYLCGRNDNSSLQGILDNSVVICSKFITFVVEMTTVTCLGQLGGSCDLLKIHYLCGRNDNTRRLKRLLVMVVICSKFITFVVEMTTASVGEEPPIRCDLLKIHYLCGRNDNEVEKMSSTDKVVICSKFITFVVEMTTPNRDR